MSKELMIHEEWFAQKCIDLLDVSYYECNIIFYDVDEFRMSVPNYIIQALIRWNGTISCNGVIRFCGIQVLEGYENKVVIFHKDVPIKGRTPETYFEKQIP